MLKKIARMLLGPVIRIFAYLRKETRDREDLHFVVWRRAAQSSATYVEAHLSRALVFPSREQLWGHALSKVSIDGLHMEFGVYSGYSINWFARVIERKGAKIYGFDSFEGLKEDWHGTGLTRGAFDLGGRLPRVRKNVELIKGWFDATVPTFLSRGQEPAAFIHLDADTYESTKLVLGLLSGRIVPGTIIVLDEYLGFPNWQNGEFRAWAEYVTQKNIRYEYIGFSPQQAALRVL